MKQVVFAIALLAMASLTGCLNTDDTSVDENIDTTDDSTSDTTEDNSDTTDDTKDDELIEPVGQTGDTTIPEDSSIFIDQSSSSSYQGGKWECTDASYGDSVDTECDFIYHGDDYFSSESATYYDADFIRNAFYFNGWVNKTGETVTIESLYIPERDSYISENIQEEWDEDLEEYVNIPTMNYYNLGRWVTDNCNTDTCEIIFYGHGGLTFTGSFKLSNYQAHYDWLDTDDDSKVDLVKIQYFYEHFTVTFDLPFEPYGFSLIYNGEQIDRIF